jgi:hypothetical protein
MLSSHWMIKFSSTLYVIIWLDGDIDVIISLDDNILLNPLCYHWAGLTLMLSSLWMITLCVIIGLDFDIDIIMIG